MVFNNNIQHNNNNTSICKAHNVSIRAESEAPLLLYAIAYNFRLKISPKMQYEVMPVTLHVLLKL